MQLRREGDFGHANTSTRKHVSTLMTGLSLDVLRVGKRYRVLNFGENHELEIEERTTDSDFKVKDLHTLERYRLSDIYRFGKGKDFEIREME